MFGKYEPVKHTGTRREIILGLMREWWDIDHDGMMRIHAQEREKNRIAAALLDLGIDLNEEHVEEGWLYAREGSKPHGPACDENHCGCEPDFKVWRDEGFEDGVGRWEQQDVYGAVEVGDPRYNTAGMTSFGTSVNGPWYTHAVTGKEWVWVGPPSPVPVPKPDAGALKTFSSERSTVPALSLGYQGSPISLSLPPPQIRVEPKQDPPAAQVSDRFKHLLDAIVEGDDLINDYNRMYSDASCEDGRVESRGVETLLLLLEGALSDQKLLDGSVSDLFAYLDDQVRGEADEDEDYEEDEDGEDW